MRRDCITIGRGITILTLGRFISEDPMGFGAGDTNLYRYVNNSPTNYTDPTGKWLNFAIGAGIGFVLDLGMQLWENQGTDKGIDLTRLAISTGIGAISSGVGGALIKQGTGLAARTALNAGVGFNTGYWGKVAENGIKGQDLTNGALEHGIGAGAGAAAGELLFAGAGKLATNAWNRYGGSIISGIKSADQWTGSAFSLLKNPLLQTQEALAGDVTAMGGRRGLGLNWDESADPASYQFMAMVTGGSGGSRHNRLLQMNKQVTGETYYKAPPLPTTKPNAVDLLPRGIDGLPVINGQRPTNYKYQNSTYHLEDDLALKYPKGVKFDNDGFPDFSSYVPKIAGKRTTVEINMIGDHDLDFRAANIAAGFGDKVKPPKGYTWHHNQDGKTMQLVSQDIHDAVKHTGGVAITKHLNSTIN